jgi:hypothetical protein
MDEEKKPDAPKTAAHVSGPTTIAPQPMPTTEKISGSEWDRSPYQAVFRIGVNMFLSAILCWCSIGLTLLLFTMGQQGLGWAEDHRGYDWIGIFGTIFWGALVCLPYLAFSGFSGFLCFMVVAVLYVRAIYASTWSMFFRRCSLVMFVIFLSLTYVHFGS